MATPAPTSPPADPATPALPDKIRLRAEYAWFNAAGDFVHRAAGDLVTDAEEIAYLVALPAAFAEE